MPDASPESPPDNVFTRKPAHLPPAVQASLKRYWRMNVLVMATLLSVWAAVGLGCGVLLADHLNQYKLGGYPLGFWFAQQGSIITFVLIILVYATAMNWLDKKHHREIEGLRDAHGQSRSSSAASSEAGVGGGDA